MRRRLRTNVVANVLNAGTGLAVAAVSTPLILDQLGKAAFGIWTIVASFVVYLAIAESGFGPAVQRFVAVSHGAEERRGAARLMWTVVALYVLVGGGACLALQLFAPSIIDLFDFPLALRSDAIDLTRIVGAAIPVSLIATGLGNVLYGLERFAVAAVSTACGAIVLLIGVITALSVDEGLPGLGVALLAQQGTLLLVRVAALRGLVATGPPALASRGDLREMVSFSARLQVSALGVLINGQSDKVVVGLVAPAATVGQLGIASQLAESGRLIGGAVLQPIISRLAVVIGQGNTDHLADEYRKLSRLWLIVVTGATAVGIGILHPLLVSWLGDGYGEAFVLGSILVLAYGVNLLTGIASAYLRATGAIGIEARAGVLMVGLNVAFTVPLAFAAGALGVVLGTLGAYVCGTFWFLSRMHRVVPALPPEPWRVLTRQLLLAGAAAAFAFGAGSLMAAALPRFVAIVPVGIVAGVALGGYLAASLGPPSRGPRARSGQAPVHSA